MTVQPFNMHHMRPVTVLLGACVVLSPGRPSPYPRPPPVVRPKQAWLEPVSLNMHSYQPP